RDYNDEVNLYNASVTSQNDSSSKEQFDNSVQIDEIFRLVQELYGLPINGTLIKEQVERMKEGQVYAAQSDEQFVDLPRGYNSPDILKELKTIVNRKQQ
ncbi:unnamed protein product, partial [Rotaria magnacalcarata]